MNKPIGALRAPANGFGRSSPLPALGHWLHATATGVALAGGLIFLGLIVISLCSIIGRKIASSPVHGDIELMQMGTAVAAAAFLPYCTMMGENLKVDFFTEGMGKAAKLKIDGIADLVLGLIMAVLAWRTGLQAIDIREASEVSTLLSIPMWVSVLGIVPGLALTALCSLHRAASALSGAEKVLQ